MTIKLTATLALIIVINNVASALAAIKDTPSLINTPSFSHIGEDVVYQLLQTKAISIKKGEPYDETKDPALRKGTENWEEKQSSFFVVPGLFIGVVLLFYFFGRLK